MTALAADTAVQRLRDQVRDAVERRVSLRIRGSGTWMDAGRQVDASETISIAEHAGIVAYVPGDLTMTIRAGTTLAEIRDAAAAHNQWLALDPFGDLDGTIGATTVTASAGPLATFFGTPRDLVLGVEFVTGKGVIARGGGRVVKNVAGFDLTRLIIGSWGTIGVVTEITVRLHAKPETDRSFAIAIGDDGIDLVRALLRRLPFKPYACEVVNTPLATVLTGATTPIALLRLAGNSESVAAQHLAFAELGAASEVAHDIWAKLRAIEPPSASVVRLSDLPSNIASTWTSANVANAFVHASPARGVARVIAANGASLASVIAQRTNGQTLIGERLPCEQWSALSAPRSDLNARIKQTFDPSDVLNRRILGVEA